MDFAHQQRNPLKHLIGFLFVIALHVLVVYALVTGLARKVVEVVRAPIETKIIEEVRPPPPPEVLLPPPPKLAAPPPPFIPPPEVKIAQPPPPQETIAAVTNVQPVAPPPPPAPPAPAPEPVPPPPTPQVQNVAVACPNVQSVAKEIEYPTRARQRGVSAGDVVLEFVVGPEGDVKNPSVLRSSNTAFNDAALQGARMLRCRGQGQEVKVRWQVAFRLVD